MWIPKRFNEQEASAFRLTVVVFLAGVVLRLIYLCCKDCQIIDLAGTIGIALGAGSTASVITSHIMRTIREREVRDHFEKYAGAWKRMSLYQYSHLAVGEDGKLKLAGRQRTGATTSRDEKGQPIPADQVVDGRSITISYEKGRTMTLLADYDPATRGTVRGRVEFDADKGIVGVGTYLYVAGPLWSHDSNDGLPHSGKYTLHLFPGIDDDLIYAYYDGLQPSPDARGYEVWRKDPHGSHHLSWD